MKKVVIMACCWVAETVEMKSPMPSVLRRKIQVARKRSSTLPAMGRLNQTLAMRVTPIIWTMDMMM